MKLLLPKQIRLRVMNYDEPFKTAFCGIADGESLREIKTKNSFTIKLILIRSDSNECSAFISCSCKKAILRNIFVKMLLLKNNRSTRNHFNMLKAAFKWKSFYFKKLRSPLLKSHSTKRNCFSQANSQVPLKVLKFRMNSFKLAKARDEKHFMFNISERSRME